MSSNHILNEARKFTDYDMILAHTDLPEFPEHRVHLLYTFLRHDALKISDGDYEHELYTLAMTLMQMGLDTHDMVTGDNVSENVNIMRSNQLKVLAGDYFSSRFYQLLAKKGRIDFIQRVSEAICELNRTKMNFYLNIQHMRMTAEDFIKQSVLIKTQLFLPFSHMMKDTFSRKWTDLLHCISQCEVIVEQIKMDEGNESDESTWSFWYRQKHKKATDFMPTLHAMLERQLAMLNEQIQLVGSEQMSQELSRIGEYFLDVLNTPHARQGI